MSHRFSGISSLREKDKVPSEEEDSPQRSRDLQAYLEQHYISTPTSKMKKKKKKKKDGQSTLRIIDNDVSGFIAMDRGPTLEEVDPEGPVVVNEAEAEIARRFEQKQKTRKYFGEGGWTTAETEPEAPDLSPPRQPRMETLQKGNDDLSPPRYPKKSKIQNEEKDQDPSLPSHSEIETTQHEDLSPPRHLKKSKIQDNDLFPSRQSRMETAQNKVLSPPRHPKKSKIKDEDLSPPREKGRGDDRKRRMLDGSHTGVVTGHQMREEIRKKRKEDKERIYGMNAEVTGRGAETIYRNKQGQRTSLEELKKAEEEEQEKKRKTKWEKVEWDSGLAQQREIKRQKGELAKQMVKPFARTRDDEDLDAMYRARVHWGDPMSQHLAKKQKTPNAKSKHNLLPVIDETNRHWFEKSGFVIPQNVPEHSWIRRGVAPLSNRYGIKPGRHWDGVDRSNGFEKEYIRHTNEQAAKEKEAAMWTMEDM